MKIYLLNDTTRDINHIGCQTVINTIKFFCDKFNHEIIFFDKDSPYYLVKNDKELVNDMIKKCDIVIFNGEGSLHNNNLSFFSKM